MNGRRLPIGIRPFASCATRMPTTSAGIPDEGVILPLECLEEEAGIPAPPSQRGVAFVPSAAGIAPENRVRGSGRLTVASLDMNEGGAGNHSARSDCPMIASVLHPVASTITGSGIL